MKSTTAINWKELRINTLRGDIQSCAKSGYLKKGISYILFDRYVNGVEIPITKEEFNNVINEELKKFPPQKESKS